MNKSLIELFNSFGEIKENTWLNGRSYSEAFLLCISSGPWRINRRLTIQTQAINFVAGRDLSKINEEILFFPLSWQNSFLNSAVKNLKLQNKTMEKYCDLISKELIISNNRLILYNLCGCPKGAKVLSLFCRDSLKIKNCFPIDRHVKRFLKEHNLPTVEDKMVKLCIENEINPRLFNIGLSQQLGINNPDWKI